MVAAGPNPGRMPTTVPSRQPTKHQNTFAGCNATANPCSNPPSTSISEPEIAGRQRHAQNDGKGDVERERRRDRGEAGGGGRAPEHERDNRKGEERKADEKSERIHQRDRC